MKKILGSGVLLAVLLTAASAQAQAPGAHTHDGLYLQMDLGLGWMGSSAEQGGTELKLSGGGGEFSIAVGAALSPNFIVAGQVFTVSVPDPDVELNGVSASANGSLSLTGFGVQLAYYFVPMNVYLSATPAITKISVTDSGSTAETEYGFGMKLAIGKEWWVSDNWAIGVNGQFAFSSNKDKGTNAPTFGTTWFGVGFSATYD